MNEGTKTDHRPSTRHALRADVFLRFRPHPDRLGKLKEASSDGVTFEYAVFDQYDKMIDVETEVEVDIFASKAGRFTQISVPCKVVHDIEIEKPSFIGIKTKCCILKFKQLSYQQGKQVSSLLNNYMSHPISDEYTASESST
jgi:hypothetical protein